MTPQEHYDEAERLLGYALDKPRGAACRWQQQQAQIHATLAMAGFTRDAATAHVHKVPAPIGPFPSISDKGVPA